MGMLITEDMAEYLMEIIPVHQDFRFWFSLLSSYYYVAIIKKSSPWL